MKLPLTFRTFYETFKPIQLFRYWHFCLHALLVQRDAKDVSIDTLDDKSSLHNATTSQSLDYTTEKP